MKTNNAINGLFRAGILVLIIVGTFALMFNMKETAMSQNNGDKFKKLTTEEKAVIIDKGTERPFTGKFYDFNEKGTYVCKQCGAPLYRSADKFDAGCGWPSFDDEIPGAIKRQTDADGHRTEIVCAKCGAHLGHVFLGEGFTPKNTRHCVNSISMDFIPDSEMKMASAETTMASDNAMMGNKKSMMADEKRADTAYFAGGCFWGVEYYMQKIDGVIATTVGFMGGHTNDPTYKDVCYDNTGYAETIQVVYDPSKTTYEKIARTFFEIHDPTELNRQGPDVGDQYRSAVFYQNDMQKDVADSLVNILKVKGYKVVTEVTKAGKFYAAEDYHQDYYKKKHGTPYCHGYVKRF